MATKKTDWKSLFERKFRPAFREIECLEGKINSKEGFLFFRVHTYTLNELLQSEHHAKINSIAEKIGDDVDTWYKRGEMSEKGKRVYEKKRYETEEALHQVNLKIQARKPTLWEQASKAFLRFVQVVMDKLPVPVRSVLEGVMAEVLALPLIGITARLFLPSSRDIS